jgi:hypothetical protein
MAVVEDRRPIAVITQRQVLASWLSALAIEQAMRRPYGATSNADLVDLALADD